ncbi:hypothetical protein DL93DRAFT_797049 [Clavulina sp. PMI_390]|nr:hypothetical protein DL93DRAFT_797049 [Clavulina sp. PMI_390]
MQASTSKTPGAASPAPVTPIGPRRSQRVLHQPERTLSNTKAPPSYNAPKPAHTQPQSYAYASLPGGNPVHVETQALSSSYASRMRTGSTLLMQPISTTAASHNTGAAISLAALGPTRRRGGVVNYAEGGSDDEFEAAESENDDESGKGGSKRGTPRLGGPSFRVGSPSTAPPAPVKQELDKSYLGLIPPSKFFSTKAFNKMRHDYPSPSDLQRIAEAREILIPIRIDLDTETHRIRDAFLWNLNEEFTTPEGFARIFCADLELPFVPYVDQVAGAIRAQLEEHAVVATFELEPELWELEDRDEDRDSPIVVLSSTVAEQAERGKTADSVRPNSPGEYTSRQASQTQNVTTPIASQPLEDAAGADATTTGDGVGDQDDAAVDEEVEERPQLDARVLLALDVQINKHHLLDTVEWDLAPSQLSKRPVVPSHLITNAGEASSLASIQTSHYSYQQLPTVSQLEIEPSSRSQIALPAMSFPVLPPPPLIHGSTTLPSTPEAFARILCADIGLSGEAVPLIAHALHEEILKHKKDAIEWGVFNTEPLSARARQRNPFGLGPKPLKAVWRDWIEVGDFTPRLEVMSQEELERREIERERIARRLRRDTSRYVKAASGGGGGRRKR